MRFPFQARSAQKPIRIPLPERLRVAFAVYFRAKDGSVPDEEDAKAIIRSWLDWGADDPLFTAVSHRIGSDGFSIHSGPRDVLPAPPPELLAHLSRGEAEMERFKDATHAVLVWTEAPASRPYAGLWAAVAGARALARALGGVILDPQIPRLEALETHDEPLPAGGRIAIAEHIILPTSTDRRGLAWMTSKGLGKFGIPELELTDVPARLETALMPVLNGFAQQLLSAAEEASTGPSPARELVLDGSVRLTLSSIAEAGGAQEDPGLPAGSQGWTDIGVDYRPSRRHDSFLRLGPPKGFASRDRGVWLNTMLGELFESAPDEVVTIEGGDEAMGAAHRRAVAELPEVKARFAAGIAPGDTLYVKCGFAVTGEGPNVEYLWVAVQSWRGDHIRGQLANDPQWKRGLRVGQTVDVRQADLFDWMLTHQDGEREGGYTTRVLQGDGDGS